MNCYLKYGLLFTLVSFILCAGCKKSSLPSETTSAVKAFDFYAAGGAKTYDNGFIIYCSEAFNLYEITDKIVKLGPDGTINWQYSFPPASINDTTFSFVNVLDIVGTNTGYNALIVRDSVSGITNKNYFYFVGFDRSGKKLLEQPICNTNNPSYFSFTGNILPLSNGNWLIGFNSAPYYVLFELSGLGNRIYFNLNYIPGKTIASINNISIAKLAQTSSGNILMVGSYGYIGLMDTTTTLPLKSEVVSGSQNNFYDLYDNIISVNGNYLLTGFSNAGNSSVFHYNYLATMINPNNIAGTPLFTKKMGTPKQNYCLSSILTNDNNFALIGIANYESNTLEDYASSILYIKLDANGNELSTQTLADELGSGGLLISENPDNSFNILGTKLAYVGNSGFYQTIFIHTSLH
jgi:hypothetical protein